MFNKDLSEKVLNDGVLCDFAPVSYDSLSKIGGGFAASMSCANGAGHGGGEAAPLDLTIGHLSTDTIQQSTIVNDFAFDDSIPFIKSSRYVPMQRLAGEPVAGWFNLQGRAYRDVTLVAKVQPLQAGGYEVVISWLDLEKIAHAMDRERIGGKREAREQNENDVIRSRQRSKKQVRLKIKSMGCDRLLTLTRRESNPLEFWRLEDWAAAWKKFVRLCDKLGVTLQYVAVPEMHAKGNYHLHAAISGHVNIKIIRQLWWVCCGGRGQGNVDISFKAHVSDLKRRAGVSKYVSKYITKQQFTAFNKKRYWSSRHALPPVRRYVLGGDNVYSGLLELAEILGLADYKVMDKKRVFFFPNGSGCWFSYSEELALPPPF
jgi:hypothetical protein